MNITQNNAGMTVVQKIQMDSCTAISKSRNMKSGKSTETSNYQKSTC